jgi:hypothetical protein
MQLRVVDILGGLTGTIIWPSGTARRTRSTSAAFNPQAGATLALKWTTQMDPTTCTTRRSPVRSFVGLCSSAF